MRSSLRMDEVVDSWRYSAGILFVERLFTARAGRHAVSNHSVLYHRIYQPLKLPLRDTSWLITIGILRQLRLLKKIVRAKFVLNVETRRAIFLVATCKRFAA